MTTKFASGKSNDIINLLDRKLKKSDEGSVIPFHDFLARAREDPLLYFRNVFQLFSDMIYYYIDIEDEYKDDPESISYKTINCERLFVENTDTPFFTDLPLANRLIRLADSFREGTQQNKIYVFMGPPGSGKKRSIGVFNKQSFAINCLVANAFRIVFIFIFNIDIIINHIAE